MMAQQKLPVLFLIDCLYGDAKGGSESQFRKAYECANEMGLEPHVVFLRHREIHDKLVWVNKPLHVNLTSFSPLQFRRAAREIEDYLACNEIEIVQSLFDDASIMACALKIRQPSLKFVCTQRNLGHSRGKFRRWIFKQVYRAADAVLVNSQAIEELLLSSYKVEGRKIRLIDNMHDGDAACIESGRATNSELRRFEETKLGVVVANLRPVKGIVDLIDACALLSSESRLDFLLVGDGPERNRYERMILEKGLSSRMRLLGYVEDVYSVLSRVDFAVLPSHSEGGSNSLIEYMLSELPIVATNVGGNSDFLCGGKFGVLVKPKDPVSLRVGLLEIENNYQKWKKAAQDGRKYALSRFSLQSIVSAYKSFYLEISRSDANIA